MVKYLFNYDVDVNDEDFDALDYAAENGHLDVVQYLVKQGVKSYETAIDWAAKNGHVKVVEYLESLKQC